MQRGSRSLSLHLASHSPRWLTAALLAGLALVSSAGAHPLVQEGPAHPVIASFERFTTAQDDDAKLREAGLLLLNELNCTTCHAAPQAWAARLPGRDKISLAGVGSRLDAAALRGFIQDPQGTKHGTLMPALLGGAGEERDKTVAALAAYLATLKKEPRKFPQGDVKRGIELYHTIGCVACHQPDTAAGYKPVEATPGAPIVAPTHASVPIRLAGSYDLQSLAAFLKDPLSIRKHGRMPSTEMSDQEAADIAAYLHFFKKPVEKSAASQPGAAAPDKALQEQGRKLFATQRCYACHDASTPAPGGKAAPKVTSPVTPAAALATLKVGQGCLAAQPSPGSPSFALSELQRKAITLALREIQATAMPPALTAVQRTDAFFKTMDCYACHEVHGTGGLEDARAQYFTVIEPAAHSMGEIGRLPPKLDVVGRKLTREWIEKMLWGSKGGVRPYMTARMPRFGKSNCAPNVAALIEASKRDKPIAIDTSGLAKHHRAENGRALIGLGKGGLGCVSCHGLKDRKSLGVPVVNLTFTTQRLQPEYFKELLLNPQATQPGTLMPPLFLARKAADKEVEMLWTYLKELDQSRLPEGLLQTGDYELKPEKGSRPVVFRTFLEGAGMHAVAVGFPQQLHVAFDALEMHWAIAWKGQFVDAMTTWEERAMTPAKPLGKPVLTLPARMPLAKLGSASESWPEACGVKAGYVERGYRVGKDGVPVFLYDVQGLQVEDSMKPSADKKSLVRTLKVTGAGDSWYFLGVGKDAAPQPVVWKDGSAVFEEVITW